MINVRQLHMLDVYRGGKSGDLFHLRVDWRTNVPAKPRDSAMERVALKLQLRRIEVRAVLNEAPHGLDPLLTGLVLDGLRREGFGIMRARYRRWWNSPETTRLFSDTSQLVESGATNAAWTKRGFNSDRVEQWVVAAADDFASFARSSHPPPGVERAL